MKKGFLRFVALLLISVACWGWLGSAAPAAPDNVTPQHNPSCPYTICNADEVVFASYDYFGTYVIANFPSGPIRFNVEKASPQGGGTFVAASGDYCGNARLQFHYQDDNDLHGSSRVDYYHISTKTCEDAVSSGATMLRNMYDRTGKDICPEDQNPPGCSGPPAIGSSGGSTTSASSSAASASTNPGNCPGGQFFFLPPWYEYLDCNQFGAPIVRFPRAIIPIAMAIIDLLLRLAGLVAIFSVIYSGITYMTSGGNAEKAASARRRLYNSGAGLAIVAIAAGVVAFIGNSLGG